MRYCMRSDATRSDWLPQLPNRTSRSVGKNNAQKNPTEAYKCHVEHVGNALDSFPVYSVFVFSMFDYPLEMPIPSLSTHPGGPHAGQAQCPSTILYSILLELRGKGPNPQLNLNQVNMNYTHPVRILPTIFDGWLPSSAHRETVQGTYL